MEKKMTGGRITAWALALVLVLTAFVIPAQAESPDFAQLVLEISWQNAWGETVTEQAQWMPNAESPSYWLQVPADAPLNALYLHLIDPMEKYSFKPGDGIITNVVDAGPLPTEEAAYTISVFEDGQRLAKLALYISTQINPDPPMIEDPNLPIAPTEAYVQVIYRDQTGVVFEQAMIPVQTGTAQTFSAHEYDGYILTGMDNVTVMVDAYGNPSQGVVEFVYAPRAKAQAFVEIAYRDVAQRPLRESDFITVTEGTPYPATAPEIADYVHSGETQYTVTVDASGAPNMNPVVFYYTERPKQQAVVEIAYRDVAQRKLRESDFITVTEGSPYIATAPEIAEYLHSGETQYTVTVDASGAPNMNPVVFYYTERPKQQAVVEIAYRDVAQRPLRESDFITVTEGTPYP
ncbi:MAG: hypothetical protein Q4E72_09825, partial [bacterium]|nr:hypothetical protein [bacterium]